MNQKIRIAIIGAGSAGPAAALFLQRQGHEIHLFEKVKDLSPVGAGVLIQPTGLEVLKCLGLKEKFIQHGSPVYRLKVVKENQKPLMNLSYSLLEKDLFGLGIHRGVIFKTLFDQLSSEKIPLHLGVEIQDWKEENKKVSLWDQQKQKWEGFDLLILADGARSHLRKKISSLKKEKPYPWGAMWFIGEDVEGKFSEELFQTVSGTQRMVGFLPSGHLENSSKRLVSFFWSIDSQEKEKFYQSSLSHFKEEVLKLVPKSENLLKQIESTNQLLYAGYWDVVMNPWHQGSVVCIGDAAHAMSPQLGQGVNLGLIDAWTLAECISQFQNLDLALHQYNSYRKKHLRFYQWMTRLLTPYFQSNHKSYGFLRDVFFPLANKIPWVNQQMIATMAGIKRGILRESYPLGKVWMQR